MESSSFPSSSSFPTFPQLSSRWKVGDVVLAQYSDKQYYDAVVEQLGAAMIHVRFLGYGDRVMVCDQQIKERPPLHPDFNEYVDVKTGHTYYMNTKTGESSWSRPTEEIDGGEMDELERSAFEQTKKMMRERSRRRQEALWDENSGLFYDSQPQKQPQTPIEVASAWVPESETTIPGTGWGNSRVARGAYRYRIPLPGGPCGCGKMGC